MGVLGNHLGELFALLAATSFALANVTISLGAVRRKGDNGALLSVLMTGAVSLALWAAIGPRAIDAAAASFLPGVFWFAFSGLLTTVFGRIFLFRSIQELGIVRASAVKRLIPFFSVLLGWAILGELISSPMLAGMALIAAAFLILLRQTIAGGTTAPSLGAMLPGPASALCYAGGYLTRKIGLTLLPDAALGTLISSIAALVYYLAAAPFVVDYRRAFREAFVAVNGWQLASAVLISLGQVSIFAALSFADIARVAMIASVEVFIAMFVAVVFLKQAIPDAGVLIATALATIGVLLVAAG